MTATIKPKPWTDQETRLFRKLWRKHTTAEIANQMGFHIETIRKKARELGVAHDTRSARASKLKMEQYKDTRDVVLPDMEQICKEFEKRFVEVANRNGWKVWDYAA